ncbi:13029_t:CDS:2 [Ambispora gerdemannii]|uniref:13029_t:CDS:1 n=1 Tax=Ambispora gerdemannii TaxID=144530 RepID=A0A9N9AX55_9GLOM|nr:13029_t:CDS:2 [Ambispora gerdemannii]
MSSSSPFITFLLRDFARLQENAEDYDCTIKVVKDENAKSFRAHSVILRARSPHFQKILSKESLAADFRNGGMNGTAKPRKQKIISVLMEKISPFAFEVLLKYMYTGNLEYENYKASDVLEILTTANQLGLAELVDILQDYLIERKTGWLQQNFASTYNAAFSHPSLKKLQQLCNRVVDKSPATILRALDFNKLTPDFVISLMEREDLVELEEIHIWNKIIEWGIAQTPFLPTNVSEWSAAEFIVLRTTLRPILLLVRFLEISREDFLEKVAPFQPIFPNQLYADIIMAHSNPEYTPVTPILSSRSPSFKINSALMNAKHASWLASCIDRKDEDSDSFIFSLGDDNLNDAILSRIENHEYAICQDASEGPSFGVDIVLRGDFKDPKQCYCNKNVYEYSIMEGSDHELVYFAIEEYEVFQVVKKRA